MKINRAHLLAASILLAAFWLKEDTIWFLLWWLVLLGLGLVFLPFTSLIFGGFKGKGYFFSKIIGLAIAGYITWMFAMHKILPFTAWAAYLILALCLYVNVLISRKTDIWRSFLKDDGLKRHALGQEIVFMLALLFWSYLRGLRPEIIGLEKYMDFGFLNSILRGTFFPPLDMWYASESINYYYLGHYYAAYLTRLSFVPSQISYNLMMASLFAISFMAAYNIGVYLIGIRNEFSSDNGMFKYAETFCGLLTGTLVTLSGSLHTPIYAWLLKGESATYWFPDATRYIGVNPPVPNDATIHEFPLYSYVVSDLHAHVLNMIFVLTVIAVTIAVGVKVIRRIPGGGETEAEVPFREYIPGLGYFVLVFMIGLFPATNFWDFPIYIVVTSLMLFYVNLRRFRFGLESLLVTLCQASLLALLAFAVLTPFHMTFVAMSSSIEMVTTRTKFYQLLVLYGYQAAFFLMLIIFTIVTYIKSKAGGNEKRLPRLFDFIERLNPADAFALILFSCAIGLIAIPEFIYVKDIYTDSPRANTMFKLTYQAFILLTLSIGYTFTRLFLTRAYIYTHSITTRAVRIMMFVPAAALLSLGLVYPFYAINSWYAPFAEYTSYKGLDGVKYMLTYEEQLSKIGKETFPEGEEPQEPYPMVRSIEEDYPIVQYLNEHVKGQPVIIEANLDDPYTSFGRIAVNTGLPSVFNWYTHQWLWRNADFGAFNARTADIDTFYATGDETAARNVINKYNIKYIVIGKLERARFRNRVNEELLLSFGDVVCRSGDTVLIEVR
ncbi:MAG: DUF2298 domain-containing protein [Clostridiales bacterium]|jgi:uncharacterized membrane protein|nr:DUF2298 domain-containing protein [Clostridiales bacterium]